MAKNAVQSTPDTPKCRRKRMMSDAEVIKSSSVSTSTPTATSSIITRPVCALFGRLWSEGIHVVTGLRSNMKQRLMPLYDKIMLRRGALSRPWTACLKTWRSLCTRHRSVHNFLINLFAAMGRTASSSPSQQSTSTTRCRTQTVDSPFVNSSNPIFTEAHQAANTISASESRLFSQRLSRTRVVR